MFRHISELILFLYRCADFVWRSHKLTAGNSDIHQLSCGKFISKGIGMVPFGNLAGKDYLVDVCFICSLYMGCPGDKLLWGKLGESGSTHNECCQTSEYAFHLHYYFANATERVSRMTVILTCPG